jgi:hypothetical protein
MRKVNKGTLGKGITAIPASKGSFLGGINIQDMVLRMKELRLTLKRGKYLPHKGYLDFLAYSESYKQYSATGEQVTNYEP